MQPARNGLRILVADDSSTVRRFVTDAVAKSGIAATCVEAADGRGCLGELSAGKVDIAFIDVNMPNLSGMDALAQSRREGGKTFVVMMSAESDVGKLAAARNLGAYEYLAKPFSQNDITGIVQNYRRFMNRSSVLLVDDSSSTRAVIQRVLANSIFELRIDEVADGPSALVRYQEGRHDIVFLDINMPGIDGLDTLEMLRKLNPDVKVVLITARQGANEAQFPEEGGHAAVLYKPFFADDVDRALHALFGLRMPALDEVTREAVFID